MKPNFHFQNHKDNKLLFASELKALVECDQIKLVINKNAINDYLSFLYVPPPKTIFENIYKLLPGEMLIFNQDGKYETQTYWDIKFSNEHKTEEEYTKKLRELLDESIDLNLQINQDDRVEFSLLPLSDGLSFIRKK